MVGFGLMYGSSVSGLFGSTLFFYSTDDTSFSAYLIISLLIATILYPIPGHWIWAGATLEVSTDATQGWLVRLGFIDFAGGAAVHLLGGCLALVAVLIVGPRIGRFSRGAKSSVHHSMNASNYPMATVGVLIVWFLFRTHKPNIGSALNGTLAGLVGITAGVHVYSTSDAVLVGISSAAAMQCATNALEKYEIDDVVGAFPVHGVAGLVGILLVAILGDNALFPHGNTNLFQFGIQMLGAAVVAAWSVGGSEYF